MVLKFKSKGRPPKFPNLPALPTWLTDLENRQAGTRSTCCRSRGRTRCDPPNGSARRSRSIRRREEPETNLFSALLDQLLKRWNSCHTNPYTPPIHCRAYHRGPRYWAFSGRPGERFRNLHGMTSLIRVHSFLLVGASHPKASGCDKNKLHSRIVCIPLSHSHLH